MLPTPSTHRRPLSLANSALTMVAFNDRSMGGDINGRARQRSFAASRTGWASVDFQKL